MTTDQPIRVGFVLHSMQVAGAEVLVLETIRGLGNRISPIVFCLDSFGDLGRKLRFEGIPVVWLGREPGLDLRLAVRLARETRIRGIEVLHAHQYTPFFYSALARIAGSPSTKLVFTEHGRHFPDEVPSARMWTNRLLLRHLADEVNACSRFSCIALAEKDGFAAEQIRLIENGIHVSDYGRSTRLEEARAELGLERDVTYLASVARFHSVKDHATLLRAFARVSRTHGEVELLLAGDGPLRKELQAQTRTLGIESRVHFLGVRDDVRKILSVVDCFAMTSLSEAASLTILEAMASELPVVVTAVGGNPEMIEDGVQGYLVPRGEDKVVASRILDLLGSQERRRAMGRAGRQEVERRYRIERTVDEYWSLYEGLRSERFGS